MAGKNYQDLIAWQKAMQLVELVYDLTREFPREEIYGLTSQLRRTAVSVPSNIAEGQGRGTKREFAHFLSIAHGALRELETQVIIARRLGFAADAAVAKVLELAAEVGRLITGLANSLRK